MSEHHIRQNDIIYIIPNDVLFDKWTNKEAFIDEYGRLINRKPHRVLKELKHYVEKPCTIQSKPITQPTVPVRKGPSFGDQIKDSVRANLEETTNEIAERASHYIAEKIAYEGIPYLWHNGIVSIWRRIKNAFSSSKETKTSTAVKLKNTTVEMATAKPAANIKMTPEEADTEKRKVLYHWIEMLSSLKKLYDAGEIADIHLTLTQLTNSAMLTKVNDFLSENPNLLEVDKYITLHELLGRDLYKEGQLIPIEATEIKTIAKIYDNTNNDSTEDDKDGR